MTQTDLLYQRCKLIQQLFLNLTEASSKVHSSVYKTRTYSHYELRKIHSYFNTMSKSVKVNGARMISSLKDYSSNAIRNNPWFKKSAKYLVLNSKLNIQSSYWKLKENVESSGQVLNANTRIKLIKLTSILKRHIDMNKWKSFYYILNYGKSDYDHLDVSKIVHDRLDRSDIVPSVMR